MHPCQEGRPLRGRPGDLVEGDWHGHLASKSAPSRNLCLDVPLATVSDHEASINAYNC